MAKKLSKAVESEEENVDAEVDETEEVAAKPAKKSKKTAKGEKSAKTKRASSELKGVRVVVYFNSGAMPLFEKAKKVVSNGKADSFAALVVAALEKYLAKS